MGETTWQTGVWHPEIVSNWECKYRQIFIGLFPTEWSLSRSFDEVYRRLVNEWTNRGRKVINGVVRICVPLPPAVPITPKNNLRYIFMVIDTLRIDRAVDLCMAYTSGFARWTLFLCAPSHHCCVWLLHSFERFPIEFPETLRVNLVPGELASLAQARGDLVCCHLWFVFPQIFLFKFNDF